MGFLSSSSLTEEEMDQLKSTTPFSAIEIEMLYDRFTFLDRSSSGFLTFAEFQMIPEFNSNPFSKLILAKLESLNNFENINFACFLEFLSIFSEKSEKIKRIEFLFEIFDLKKTGRLDSSTLTCILEIMTGDPCNDNSLVNEILLEYDKRGKGYLSRTDFTRLYNDDESLEANMILDFTRNISNSKQITLWDVLWPSFSNK